jgi:hypothetical protein
MEVKTFDCTLRVGDSVQFRGLLNFDDWTISEIYKEPSSGFARCILYNRFAIKRGVDPMDLRRRK